MKGLNLWARAMVLVCISSCTLSLQSCVTAGAQSHGSINQENPAREKDYQEAQILFTKLDLADTAYQQGQWKEAVGLYRVVLTKMPDDPYLWFRLGNSLTQQGDYDSAIRAFETSIQQDARQAKPWFNLSTAHLLGAQLATLKAWQAMDPRDPSRRAAQERLEQVTQLLR